jgi:uncharacterized protein YjlB
VLEISGRGHQFRAGNARDDAGRRKKAFEEMTGIKRPIETDLAALVQSRKANLHRFRDDGETPNNPLLPLIHYRSPVTLAASYDPAAIFEVLFAANGWTRSWRDGVYDFLHFHTRTHEVLGIAQGHVRVEFGGVKGRVFDVKAGDVIVLPAGTGHCCKSASRDLLVVGAYPENGGNYDEPRPAEIDGEEARTAIGNVALPKRDPVYGSEGPLLNCWQSGMRGKKARPRKRRT